MVVSVTKRWRKAVDPAAVEMPTTRAFTVANAAVIVAHAGAPGTPE